MENVFKNSVSGEAAVTTTTTERVNNPRTKAERIKQRAENYFNEMNSLKEEIEENVRPMVDIYCKFIDDVNEITKKEIKVHPNFIVRQFASYLCDKIIHSRMSADDKVDMLNRLNGLVYYCKSGGMLTAYSEDEEVWDRVIRDTADSRIEEREKSNKD
jgi:hypothetical protein